MEMLVEPSVEELLPEVSCAYELAVLVSKRANQLVNGAQPMVADSAANMVSLACREVAAGKVVSVEGNLKKSEYEVPLTKQARQKMEDERKAREAQENYKRAAAEAELSIQEKEMPAETEDDNASGADALNFLVVDDGAAEETVPEAVLEAEDGADE